MQNGDVYYTCGSITELQKNNGYKPTVGIKNRIKLFAKWYKEYYKVEE